MIYEDLIHTLHINREEEEEEVLMNQMHIYEGYYKLNVKNSVDYFSDKRNLF